MSNIMNQVDVKNNPHRNGFDLSHKLAFTSQSGMLLPIFSEQVLPGDSFSISVSSFTRTQPVNTAAYTRIKEYFDWYFVPLHLLWSRAPQSIVQTNDLQQWSKPTVPYSDNAQKVPSTFPSFPTQRFDNLLALLGGDSNKTKKEPYFGFRSYYGAVRLLEHLGYGFSLYHSDTVGWLHMKPINTPVNLWRLCAYQKIYNDWFRMPQWEPSQPWTFNLDYYDDDTQSFQTNWQATCAPMVQSNAASMLTMRFAPWHKDFFTGVLPSTQFGNAAAVDGSVFDGSFLLRTDKSSGTPFVIVTHNGDLGLRPSDQSNLVSFTGSPIESFADLSTIGAPYIVGRNLSNTPTPSRFEIRNSTLKSSFTILQLRLAEAQQKWSEITQSGRLDYKSQIQKHFGVTPDDALAHRSEYIGGTSGVLDINEVVNNNLTGDADANLAGKGTGAVSGHIKYTAREHGILMCIYHNEPLLDYGGALLDKQVQEVTPSELPIPEFDSIGMDSLYMHQLISDYNFTNDYILGYVPRYAHYKTKVDKVMGAFNGSLSSWVSPMNRDYVRQLLGATSSSSTPAMTLGFFHVNPALLNPIFGVDADLTPNTDQFLHNVFFDIKAARNLDRNGLPY